MDERMYACISIYISYHFIMFVDIYVYMCVCLCVFVFVHICIYTILYYDYICKNSYTYVYL